MTLDGIDGGAFGTSVEKGFDLREVKVPAPVNPDYDPRYSDAPEVVEEIFSDNRRIGKKGKYEF